MISIKGKKIVIRDWIEEDFEIYKSWHQGNYEWMKFNGPYYPLKTIAEINKEITFYKDQIKTKDFPKIRTRMVIANIETNALIGTVSWYWQSQETNWISIGLVLYDDEHWGKRMGFEALGIWSQYLFDNFEEIVRLDLRTWSGNIGMMKLAEKLGFQLEAKFRKARIVNGEYFDSIGYGILREEWSVLYPNGFVRKNK